MWVDDLLRKCLSLLLIFAPPQSNSRLPWFWSKMNVSLFFCWFYVALNVKHMLVEQIQTSESVSVVWIFGHWIWGSASWPKKETSLGIVCSIHPWAFLLMYSWKCSKFSVICLGYHCTKFVQFVTLKLNCRCAFTLSTKLPKIETFRHKSRTLLASWSRNL